MHFFHRGVFGAAGDLELFSISPQRSSWLVPSGGQRGGSKVLVESIRRPEGVTIAVREVRENVFAGDSGTESLYPVVELLLDVSRPFSHSMAESNVSSLRSTCSGIDLNRSILSSYRLLVPINQVTGNILTFGCKHPSSIRSCRRLDRHLRLKG
jgi:hypothetical protein